MNQQEIKAAADLLTTNGSQAGDALRTSIYHLARQDPALAAGLAIELTTRQDQGAIKRFTKALAVK